MISQGINKIILIGAGRVATSFALALKEKGKNIVQVYSRTEDKAKELALKVSADYTTDLKKLTAADIYIISVTDSVIKEVTARLKINNAIIVHTAGSVDMDILKSASDNYGVIYPLQTFIKGRKLDFYNMVPLCIEANNNETGKKLKALAELISGQVYELDSQKRMTLHLAAVFANNFTNYMYVIADKLLKAQNLPFKMLKPLIEETAGIIINNDIPSVNTGPAARKDLNTIKNHIEMLENYPDLKKLYELITQNIINTEL